MLWTNKRSPFWWYDFAVDGTRHRGSTKIRKTKINKLAAQQFENDQIKKVQRFGPEAIQEKVPTLAQFAESTFLPWVESSQQLRDKTRTYYKTGWRLLNGTKLAGMRMDQITAAIVDMTEFPHSAHTANNAICVLSLMLHMASDDGDRFRLRKLRKRAVVGRNLAMTEKQATMIADRMSGNPKDVLLILRATGMRPGECYAMRWEFVNWEECNYSIPRGKTKKAKRIVPLLGDSAAILQRRLIEQGSPTQGWIFSARSATGHIDSIGKAFRIARRAAGLPEALCLYTARHGAATDIAKIATLKESMELLGHSDPKVALGYQHPQTADLQSRLNEARTNGRIM